MSEAIENNPSATYRLQTECVGAVPEGVRVRKDGREEVIAADSVVFSVGQASELETVELLRDCAPEFYSVGDCVKPQRIMEAIRTGFFSAMNIL